MILVIEGDDDHSAAPAIHAPVYLLSTSLSFLTEDAVLVRSQRNDFIVAIVVTVIVIVVVVGVRRQQGRRLDGPRAGKVPGSGELVAVREVVATVQAGGQVEHQVVEAGMLEDVRQRWMATGPLLSTPERPVQIQHHVAEHVAHQQQS